ncbi:MAG: peptide chain release factor 1 [Desulfobacterota bacterium]|nr:peptide chain release factor 1 [Thermodesulfobacteriota bacterium]
MFSKLDEVVARHHELEALISDPSVFNDMKRYQSLVSERSKLAPIVEKYERYKKVLEDIEENKRLVAGDDEDLRELAREELAVLTDEQHKLERALQLMLLPKDPRDEKNVILEIRAGTGGEEAALFASDLFRMYAKYVEARRWKMETLSETLSGLKGIKEIIVSIQGKGAYSQLRYESGVHRVQRIPETETQGRIHTSAVTVAVLPEADDVDIEINPADLKIDVFRSSGPGGQSVNTTDSAVRITHIPSGLVVTCQDEKSQHKNKAKALKVLKARLLDAALRKQHEEISQQRRIMVGTGDRSERIRTYNFPQGRVTDHRINLTLYKIDRIMEGELQELIDALIAFYQAESLKASGTDAAAPVSL